MTTDLDAWFPLTWSALSDISPADASHLRLSLQEANAGFKVRNLSSPVLRAALQQFNPGRLPVFDALCASFPPLSSFSFCPLSEFLCKLSVTSHLIRPSLPLSQATNSLARQQISVLNQLPIFVPMMSACEGRWQAFIQHMAFSHRLIYNTGELDTERISPLAMHLHFNNLPSNALSYWIAGYCEGVFDTFHTSGHVTFEHRGPLSCSVLLDASPK